jgi:hypothetical protein
LVVKELVGSGAARQTNGVVRTGAGGDERLAESAALVVECRSAELRKAARPLTIRLISRPANRTLLPVAVTPRKVRVCMPVNGMRCATITSSADESSTSR